MHGSSAAAEHVLSLLSDSFNERQSQSLEDYNYYRDIAI